MMKQGCQRASTNLAPFSRPCCCLPTNIEGSAAARCGLKKEEKERSRVQRQQTQRWTTKKIPTWTQLMNQPVVVRAQDLYVSNRRRRQFNNHSNSNMNSNKNRNIQQNSMSIATTDY
jgi:hypothetical protein